MSDRDPFPIGAPIAHGRWTISEALAGSFERGVYRARGECPALVAIAGQVSPTARRDAWARFSLPQPVPGIAQLLAFEELVHRSGTYDVLVEAEPRGAPLTARRPDRPYAVGASLAAIVARAHAVGYVVDSIRPEHVYAEGDLCTGIAPRAEPFHALGPALCSGGAPAYHTFYFSPEHVRCTEITAASDVFCLCATLAYLIDGEIPFPGDHPLDLFRDILAGRIRPMDLPPIVRAGLEPDPRRRPPSAAIAAALRELDPTA
jgi:hypothetical protein